MKHRSDNEVLNFLSNWELKHFSPCFKQVAYSEVEDYNLDITCITHSGETLFQEVKSSRKQPIKINDEFNPYYRIDGTGGLFRNFLFKENKCSESGEIPEHMLGKYAYIISASTWFKRTELCDDSKWMKLYSKDNTMFVLVAEDGVLIFNNKDLKDAFLGYGLMYCPHTNDFNNRNCNYELKALLDISKAKYFKFSAKEKEKVNSILHKY